MQDLMDATGLEKGGIYRHFANKEELATEAFRLAVAQSVKLRTDHLDEIPNALDKLRRAIALFVETPSPMPGGCPLMNTAIDADDGNPALRELVLEAIQGWRSRIEAIVEAGIRAGEIRKGTRAERIANTMIATLEGALMISRLEGSKNALLDAQVALHVVLDGIATQRE
jgi:AcrR family transcriptional regulator